MEAGEGAGGEYGEKGWGQAVRGRMVMGCAWGCECGMDVWGECGGLWCVWSVHLYVGKVRQYFTKSAWRGVAGKQERVCGATTHLTVRSTDSSTYSHMEHLSPGEPWQSTRTAMAPRTAAQTHTALIDDKEDEGSGGDSG